MARGGQQEPAPRDESTQLPVFVRLTLSVCLLAVVAAAALVTAGQRNAANVRPSPHTATRPNIVPADPDGMLWVVREGFEAAGTPITLRPEQAPDAGTRAPGQVDYVELIRFPVTDLCAVFHDAVARETRVFTPDFVDDTIVLHTVSQTLQVRSEVLPLSPGRPHIAVDLDLDGFEELVIQRGDLGGGPNGYLDIHSAPDWRLRSRTVLPNMKLWLYPTAADIDDDDELEVHFTPGEDLGDAARVMILDFDPASGDFVLAADVPAADRTFGSSAVGDFDDDGNTEFITGNYLGYYLYEYVAGQVHVRGALPGVYGGRYAMAVRPLPGGQVYAMLGHSSLEKGYVYQLLRATSDNTFELEWSAGEFTGGVSGTPIRPLDADNDGLDEMVVKFGSRKAQFEWDEGRGDIVETYSWDTLDISISFWTTSDMDHDGVAEWCTVQDDWPVTELVALENPWVPPPPLFADGFEAGGMAAWMWVVL